MYAWAYLRGWLGIVWVAWHAADRRLLPPPPAAACRHISVVDERNYARGIITRRDLAHAAGSWLGRGSGGVQQDIANGLDSLLERPLLLASGAPV